MARPNPIPHTEPLSSKTALTWSAEGVAALEVRVGAPDGTLFSKSGPAGAATTGDWVSDGMTFFLQDVSDGRALTSDNTLARAVVRVASPPTFIPIAFKDTIRASRWFVNVLRRRARLTAGVRPLSDWGDEHPGASLQEHYVDQFLRSFASDVRGHCLEFQADHYTSLLGGSAVTQADILYVDRSLARPNRVPDDTYDCVICVSGLQAIFDVENAIAELHRILKPEGVLLATTPQVSMWEGDDSDLWRVTPEGLRALVERMFAPGHVLVRSFGNSLTAVGEVRGLTSGDFTKSELSYHEPAFAVAMGVRAVKEARGSSSPLRSGPASDARC